MEGEEVLGGFEEGEIVIRIYCVKKSVSNKIKCFYDSSTFLIFCGNVSVFISNFLF